MGSYCVVVKISKKCITFWYQMEGSQYAPLAIKGEYKMPLAFYINGSEFVMGEYALDMASVKDQNAYINYFELLKNPVSVFDFMSEKRPVKQLLYFGIEKYLTYFLREISFDPEWSIESHRPIFPLRLWFDLDILDNEKMLVISLFTEAGYKNLEVINYNACLLEAISKRNLCASKHNILLLTGIDNDLYFYLFLGDKSSLVFKSSIKGVGSDPRIKLLAELIYEYIIADTTYCFLDKEKQMPVLFKEASKAIKDNKPIKMGTVILSNGSQCDYCVQMNSVNDRLQYYNGYQYIFKEIDSILSNNGIVSTSLSIFLNGEDVSTDYFIDKMKQKYPNVNKLSEKIHCEAMKFLFESIEKTGYIPAISTPTLQNKEKVPIPVLLPSLSQKKLPIEPPRIFSNNSDFNNPSAKPKIPPPPQPISVNNKKLQKEIVNIKPETPPVLHASKEELLKNKINVKIQIPPPPPVSQTKNKK